MTRGRGPATLRRLRAAKSLGSRWQLATSNEQLAGIGSVSEPDSDAAPDAGVAAEVGAEAIGVKEVALELPLAVAAWEVQRSVERIGGGEADVVVLEPG